MDSSLKIALMTCFLLACHVVSAQPPAPPATPIDGGLGILLAGGAALGIKRLMKKSNKEN